MGNPCLFLTRQSPGSGELAQFLSEGSRPHLHLSTADRARASLEQGLIHWIWSLNTVRTTPERTASCPGLNHDVGCVGS